MSEYKITVGKVSVETNDLKSAASALFALAKASKANGSSEVSRMQMHSTDEPSTRKHKKHNHMKLCEVCGASFKGLQGLKTHEGWMHRGNGRPATAGDVEQVVS